MKIKVKYNAARFPRTVNLRGGKKTSFQADRLTLDLDEYDALLLLKSNNRISPERWEFTVVNEEVKKEIPIKEFKKKESPSHPFFSGETGKRDGTQNQKKKSGGKK